MTEAQIWEALQGALGASLLAGCSLEQGAAFLFFNQNPLGEPFCLAFYPQAEISLWLWSEQLPTGRLWPALSSGEDGARKILGCRLNQPALWSGALKRARRVEVIHGGDPSLPVPDETPQILLHLQPAMLAVRASRLEVRTPEQRWSSAELAQRLQRAGLVQTVPPQEALQALDRGQQLVQQQRWREAVETCQAITRIWQGASDLHRTLGYCYLGLRDWEAAIAEFTQVLKLEPNNGQARLGLAQAYEGARQPSSQLFWEAAQDLEREGHEALACEARLRAKSLEDPSNSAD